MKLKLTSSQNARLNRFLHSREFRQLPDDTRAWISDTKKSKAGQYELFWRGIELGYIPALSDVEKEVASESLGEAQVVEADKAAVENDNTPKKKELISFYIDPDQHASLKALAAAEERTVSGLIRLSISKYLNGLDS